MPAINQIWGDVTLYNPDKLADIESESGHFFTFKAFRSFLLLLTTQVAHCPLTTLLEKIEFSEGLNNLRVALGQKISFFKTI